MDIEFARTFLAVIETGSFLKASERVHATQSTVSMRIKVIEERLGQALFERRKTGVVLTPAGEKFQKHALSLVRIWEQARMEARLPDGVEAILAVGGQYSLWDGLLLNWVAHMRSENPEIAIQARLGSSQALVDQLIQGLLDLAVMYTPQLRPGFEAQFLFEEELVMVTSIRNEDPLRDDAYVLNDWGQAFLADHALHFASRLKPAVSMDLGALGLQYLLETRATGYFPHRIAKRHITSGELSLVSDVPTFNYSAFAVFENNQRSEFFTRGLEVLQRIANSIGN